MKHDLTGYSAVTRLTAVLLLVAAGVVSYMTLADRDAHANEPPIPEGVALSSWQNNGRDGRYVLQVMQEGAVPAGEQVVATVLSDTNCTPDERGLSHCHNALRLPDGSQVTVINNHRMAVNGCLRPGERLALSAVNRRWVAGRILDR